MVSTMKHYIGTVKDEDVCCYTEQEIRIENLQPSTTYIFKVRARNEIGFGSALEHTYVTEAVRKYLCTLNTTLWSYK